DPSVHISGILDAAARRRVPITVLDVEATDERDLYARKLLLVRPDQHVAWRGDEQPTVPLELIDPLRGARCASGGDTPGWRVLALRDANRCRLPCRLSG